MIKDLNATALEELKNISEPLATFHDVMIATFLVLGDHDGLAMVRTEYKPCLCVTWDLKLLVHTFYFL